MRPLLHIIYTEAEREVIKAIWLAAEQPCDKRFAEVGLPHYEKHRGAWERA